MLTTAGQQAEFIDLLLKVSRKIPVLYSVYAKEHGLTLSRARALIALKANDGIYQKDLADTLDIENASMVRLIDALAKQGLVTREVVKGNRRANNVTLTDEGNAIVGDLERYSTSLRAELLGDASAEQIEGALELLRKMAETISRNR